MKDIVERLNIVRESLEAGCDDWPIASQIWEYKTAASEIESLRQQLAASQAENESLRRANKECIEYFNESQKDLAASQAREQRLRWALREYRAFFTSIPAGIDALALPQDTSELEAVVQKAGEVMRERSISTVTWPYDPNTIRGELRALPGVTLRDLQK